MTSHCAGPMALAAGAGRLLWFSLHCRQTTAGKLSCSVSQRHHSGVQAFSLVCGDKVADETVSQLRSKLLRLVALSESGDGDQDKTKKSKTFGGEAGKCSSLDPCCWS